jgi:hypothetical protein
MGALYSEGKISRKVLEDFNKGVHPGQLPKHAGDAITRAAKRRSQIRKAKRRAP